jgi:putative transposase
MVVLRYLLRCDHRTFGVAFSWSLADNDAIALFKVTRVGKGKAGRTRRSADSEGLARSEHGKLHGFAARRGRSARPPVRRSRQARQLALAFPAAWGGARRGAGRKPSARPPTPHRARPRHLASEPVHVTLRARLAPLRSQHLFPTIRLALRRAARRDPANFRLLHFSVQHDHVHLLVEASDKRALSSGVRGIAIRIARYVNDLLCRRGSLWDDRWHGRALTSPREVRNALVYVLANFRKHTRGAVPAGIDPCSSGAWFDGWNTWHPVERAPPFAQRPQWASEESRFGEDGPVSRARSWLARVGWRRRGLLRLDEGPRG